MSVLAQPVLWLELAILAALLGALCVGPLRDPLRAWRWGLAFTAAALACAVLVSCQSSIDGSRMPDFA